MVGYAKFGDREGERGHQFLVRVDQIGRNSHVKQWGIGGQLSLMLVLVAMGRKQVGAIDRAVDGDFAFPAAANGADFLAFRGTKTLWFSLFTDRAGHGKQNTPCSRKKQKR
jgi:hypothetical protein